jgi:hypothetical protein
MQDALPTSSSQLSPAAAASQPIKKFPVAVLYTFASVIAALIVIIIVKGGFNRWLTGLERIESPAQAYTRMCYIAGLGNSGPMDYETPLEFGTRLSGHLPDNKVDIEMIVNLYIDSKYSPRREMNEFLKVRLQSTWVHLCPIVFKHSLQLKKWLPVRFVLVKWLEE